MKNKKIPKYLSKLMIIFFVLQLVIPIGLFPGRVQAQAVVSAPDTTMAVITSYISKKIDDIGTYLKEEAWEKLKKGLILSASITLRNTLVNMSREAASQTYEFATTGEWGQGPMFYDSAWGKFKDDIMDYTVAQFLENLRDVSWDTLGFDICDPGSEQLKLNIVLGLDFKNKNNKDKKRLKPDCSWEKLTKNWDEFIATIDKTAEQFQDQPFAASMLTLQRITEVSFGKKGTDVGIYLNLEDELTREQRKTVDAAEKQRTENLGSKAVTNLLGTTIQTPAWLTRGHIMNEEEAMSNAKNDEVQAASNVISDIPEAVAGAFLTTFVSKGFTDLMNKKFFEEGLVKTSQSYQPKDKLYDQSKEVSNVNQQIKTVSFNYSTKQIDLLTEFTTCPDVRQINNCVMDNNFAQIVRSASQGNPVTLAEAIESGAINADLPLIGPEDPRNADGDCYQQGFCYSNLMKLRKARIIPIGWEIAAGKVGVGENVSLRTVMDNFNEGTKDSNKFYHLVDPNWILEYPATQCKASVYGSLLVASATAARSQTCVDMTSCIKTDDNGKCLAWGYCAAEKNIFRLGGEECNGVYDSCTSLESRTGKQVNYVLNTVDRGGCSESSVGCKWYATSMSRQNGKFDWNASGTKIQLNKNIEDKECSAGDEGCTKLVRTEAGLGTNLVALGDFEIDNPVAGIVNVPGWGDLNIVTENVRDGKVSVQTASPVALPIINIVPKNYTRYFAVSADVKKVAQDPAAFFDVVNNNNNQIVEYSNAKKDLSANDTDWTRIYKIYEVIPLSQSRVSQLAFRINIAGGTVAVDNVMVEELVMPYLSEMTQFNTYANNNSTLTTYLKKAPDYLNCYNTTNAALNGRPNVESDINRADDAVKDGKVKGCSDFAKLCTAEEVGCKSYKPSDKGRAVTGVVSSEDYCPQECSGYQTFSQGSTYFENSAYPIYLIPSTAKTCSASAIGCDEFTNLDVLSAGGEGKEYYSQLKQCVKLPEPEGEATCGNYYTWTGDKTKGYQLQSFKLKKSVNEDGGPDIVGNLVAQKEVCNAEVYLAKTNPDCSEFYDQAGSVSYRLMSTTITCSANCHPYRRSIKYATANECTSRQGTFDAASGECIFMAIPGEGTKCSANGAGCREYKGNFVGDETVLYDNNFTEGKLDGLTFNNATTKLSFLPTVGQVVEITKQNNGSPVSIYNGEALKTPGEYTLSFWATAIFGTFDIKVKENNAGGAVKTTVSSNNNLPILYWKYYSFSFTVDDSFSAANYVVGIDSNNPFVIDNFKIVKNDAKKYLIKDSWETPTTCDNPLNYSGTQRTMPQAQLGCREYKDNENNTHYLKSFSSLCSADKVGCEALIDTKNTAVPFNKDYEKVLSVGDACSTYSGTVVSTTNDTCTARTPGGEITESYQRLCELISAAAPAKFSWKEGKCYEKDATVSADSFVYLVNSPDKQCKSSERGCTALGLPNLIVNAAGNYAVSSDKGWNTQFYKLDPESYETVNSPLCNSTEVACEEYTDDKGAKSFFKDPGKKLCEYRKNSATGSYRWYLKKDKASDPDIECPATSYYGDGISQLYHANDPLYDGWTGVCPQAQDKCTALVDPTDKSISTKGKAYYYINDEQIDKSSCSGVSRKDGCVLFNDTSLVDNTGSSSLKWMTFPTYLASSNANNATVPPASSDFLVDLLKSIGQYDSVMNPAMCYDGAECSQYLDTVMDFLHENNPSYLEYFKATYDDRLCESEEQFYCAKAKVLAEADKLNKNDSNTILKVVRDRECGSWYACKSSHWAWDDKQNKYIEVCDSVGLCDQVSTDESSGSCSHFVDTNTETASNLLTKNIKLSTSYSSRGTSWFDLDYTGISIPSLSPIQYYGSLDLKQNQTQETEYHCGGNYANKTCNIARNDECGNDPAGNLIKCVALPKNKEYKLVNEIPNSVCQVDIDCRASCQTKLTADGRGVAKIIGDPNVNGDNTNCRCLSSVCVVPAVGTVFVDADNPAPSCRAYPKETAPFPASVFGSQNFSAANTFWISKTVDDSFRKKDYGCYYTEVKYGKGAIVKYFPNTADFASNIPDGFCQDDEKQSCTCDFTIPKDKGGFVTPTMCVSYECTDPAKKDAEDKQPGMCMRKDSLATNYSGWQGYCLEEDVSLAKDGDKAEHPCLTWYPTQALAGLQDLQNQYKTAGFFPDGYTNGPYFCAQTENWVRRNTYIEPHHGGWDCDGGEEHGGFTLTSDSLQSIYDTFGIQDMATASSMAAGDDVADGHSSCQQFAANAQSMWSCLFENSGTDGGCWKNSCGPDLKRSGGLCPANYRTGPVSSVAHADDDGYCDWSDFDDEDTFTFNYYCIPQGIDPQNDQTKRLSGWFKDTNNNQGNATNDLTATDCHDVISVGKIDDFGNYKTASYTNRIYKANQSNTGWGDCPFGALGFKGTLSQGSVYNLFLAKAGQPACGPSSSSLAADQNVYWGGVVKPENEIKNLFAAAYGRWRHDSKAITGGTCISDNPANEKIGRYCQYSNTPDMSSNSPQYLGCRDEAETAEKYTLHKCNNDSPSNKNGFCFSDKDCGGNWAKENNVACRANAGTSCFKYCLASAGNFNQNVCTQQGGEKETVTQTQQGNSVSTDVCIAYRWSDGSLAARGQAKALQDHYECVMNGSLTKPNWDPETRYNSAVGKYDNTANAVGVPKVAAVVASGKTDNHGNPVYSAVPNALSVNGQTSGDIVGKNGQLEVTVKFYGWANDDQMPIRKVTMKWANEISGGSEGFFQNHKSRCQRLNNEKLGLCRVGGVDISGYACKDDTDCSGVANASCHYNNNSSDTSNDRFGDTSGACVESYFQFNHVYTYNEALSGCGNDSNNAACSTTYQGKPASRYRIGAQLQDNWGWCNSVNGVGSQNCTTDNVYQFYNGFVYVLKP